MIQPACQVSPPRFVQSRRKGMTELRGNKGFTLLEVLLAFVVFALSFATVLEILSGSMRNTVRAREYTEAALTAQSVMDQLGLDFPVEQGAAYAGESGDYQWEVNIYLYEDVDENAHSVQLGELTGIELLQIDLVVSWGEPPREKSNSFSTVRAMLLNRELRSE
jgi:general secretion pathway protein I